MEPAKRPELAPSIDDEAERVRGIFKSAFRASDRELDRLLPTNFLSTMSQESDLDPAIEEENFDWSLTLANVEAVVDAANASKASLQTAEKRAEVAEAKARETLHWLKMLHNAVLKGLPNKAA